MLRLTLNTLLTATWFLIHHFMVYMINPSPTFTCHSVTKDKDSPSLISTNTNYTNQFDTTSIPDLTQPIVSLSSLLLPSSTGQGQASSLSFNVQA